MASSPVEIDYTSKTVVETFLKTILNLHGLPRINSEPGMICEKT